MLLCAGTSLLIGLHAAAQQPALTAEQENAAGQSFLQQYRLVDAQRAFKRAIRLQPDYADALENLALLELMTFSEAQAGILANQLLRIAPDNFNGHLIEGIVSLDQGNPARALPYFSALNSADDPDPLVLAGMIECSVQLAQTSQARTFRDRLSRVTIDPRDAILAAQLFKKDGLQNYVIPWLEQAHISSPGNLRITLELFRAEDRAGNRPAAMKWLFEAKTTLASDSSAGDVAALIEYGSICIANRMFLDARAVLQKVAQVWPRNADVHHLLGVSYFGLDDPRNAQHEFEQSIQIDPHYVKSWISLGALYVASDDNRAAEVTLKRALELEPNSAAAYYYVGQCYRKEGKTEAAVAALRQSIKIAPRNGRSHAELGAILMAQGKTEEARNELMQAIKLDDRIASAHYQLGLLLRKAGENEQAVVHLRRARELRNDEAQNAVIVLAAPEVSKE